MKVLIPRAHLFDDMSPMCVLWVATCKPDSILVTAPVTDGKELPTFK